MNMEIATLAMIILMLGLLLLAIECFAPGGYLIIPGGVLTVVGLFGFAAPEEFYSVWTPVVPLSHVFQLPC